MDQLEIFETARQRNLVRAAPLALRMSPRSLDEFVGQEEILGRGKLLRRAIEADKLTSIILWGPPGVGKTALARVIARTTKARFERVNAVTSGVQDLRKIMETARELISRYQSRTILFIDEIHRFNKSQQDALLPAVEEGTLILIGATTENPYYEINAALLSRSRIFRLSRLQPEHIRKILQRALQDPDRGLGRYKVTITSDALEHWVHMSGGDARSALNALELAVLTTSEDEKGIKNITRKVAEESIQEKAVFYDHEGDQHYDVISAFIKSIRGSDPDAALHYLARMIRAGEDPRFIARRMVILASEDIGLADPQALIIANGAIQALDFVGMPEARLPLAEAAIYLACAPKSNSVIKAIDAALNDVAHQDIGFVPAHLRNPHCAETKELRNEQAYLYPHDFPGNYVDQQYLPDPLQDVIYYHPTTNGTEKKIKNWACGRIKECKKRNK